MLASKNIRYAFSTVICFYGRLGYNPNTLNNRIHTYFLAHHWQDKDMNAKLKAQEEQRLSYESWMNMIRNTSQLDADYKKAFLIPLMNKKNDLEIKKKKCSDKSEQRKQIEKEIQEIQKTLKEVVNNLSLFATWSLYGEGMSLSDYKAVSLFDTETGKFTYLSKQYSVTGDMGNHRTSLSNLDCNAEGASKLFGFQMDVDNSVKIRYYPCTFRNMTQKTYNLDVPWTSNQMVDWYMCGKAEKIVVAELNKQKEQRKQIKQLLELKEIYLKKNQCRYSHQTKVSTISGYLTAAQKLQQPQKQQKTKKSQQTSQHGPKLRNTPSLQNWRTIPIVQKQSQSTQNQKLATISVKQLQKGILIDFGSAAIDLNDEEHKPVYAKFTFSLFHEGQVIASETNPLSMEQVYKKQGGLYFVQTKNKIEHKELKFTLNLQFETPLKNYQFNGQQRQYTIQILDPVVKNELQQDWVLLSSHYKNLAKVPVICYQYGVPYNGTLDMEIESSYEVDEGGIDVYSDFKKVQKSVNALLDYSQVMKERYKSWKHVRSSVYRKEQQIIQKVSKHLQQYLKHSQKGDAYWIYKDSKTKIQLQFDNKSKQKKVDFKNGYANIQFSLDKDLTQQNNPRRPAIPSVTVQGGLKIIPKTSDNSQSKISPNDELNNFFYAIFYDNKDYPRKKKLGWVEDIGPILRVNGLLYPMMQKIANLYDFQKISMNSMRRVFDIEDENNSRYMPATRQMSSLDHRDIRKWLYNPLFKKSELAAQKPPSCIPGCIPTVETFIQAKEKLITSLKHAFMLQLTTIPLYLCAAFTSPSESSKKIIMNVALEEMKHLFIVSNFLNAIEDKKLFPGQKTVPYTDENYLPSYPMLPERMGILKIDYDNHDQDDHDQDVYDDDKLKKLLVFDILPFTPEQLLRFILIELPTQFDEIKFEYTGNRSKTAQKVSKLSKVLKRLRKESKKPQFKTIGELYSQIIDQLWMVSDIQQYINRNKDEKQKQHLFTGETMKQFTYYGMENVENIIDLGTALSQLRLIVQEGEGASIFSQTGYLNKESHFIKFIEEYTNCESKIVPKSIKREHNSQQGSDKEYFSVFYLEDRPQKMKSAKVKKSNWKIENDEKVRGLIKQQMESQRQDVFKQNNPQNQASHVPKYADIYALDSFTNAYKSLLKQLDFIFNVGEVQAKQICKNLSTSKERRQQIQRQKKKRMEDSISKMKQMTMLSRSVIHPIYGLNPDDQFNSQIYGFQVKDDPDIGSRPSFNVKFQTKEKIPADQQDQNKKQ